MNSKIYINIASYRDPSLIETVKSAWENADNPENLDFGIAVQYFEDEMPDLSFIPEYKLKTIHIYPNKRPGVTRVRNLIQRMHDNNDYYSLMVDSHTYFKKGWDSCLIQALTFLPENSIITSNLEDNFKDSGEGNFSVMQHKIKINKDDRSFFIHDDFPNTENILKENMTFIETNSIKCAYVFGKTESITNSIDQISEEFGLEEIYMSWRAMMHGYKIYAFKEFPIDDISEKYLKQIWGIDVAKRKSTGKDHPGNIDENGSYLNRWYRNVKEVNEKVYTEQCLQVLAFTHNVGPYSIKDENDKFELLKDRFM